MPQYTQQYLTPYVRYCCIIPSVRADRLLSLLILLQTRGKLSARFLAEALEVTERTVYRDLVSLSAAGVPVYTERGPGGGISLLESYRTNLTGLTNDEIRALFMLSIPAPLTQLGVNHELRSAMLKLAAALPAGRRGEEERTRQRFLLDPLNWDAPQDPAPFLELARQAVWQDRQLFLSYEYRHNIVSEQVVCPYALVAKADAWYLVYQKADYFRAIRLDRLKEARLCPESFERSPAFDLAAFWRVWSGRTLQPETGVQALLRADPQILADLRRHFGQVSQDTDHPDAQGWVRLRLTYKWIEDARQRLLGFGGALEVLEPLALRRAIRDFAKQTLTRYADE